MDFDFFSGRDIVFLFIGSMDNHHLRGVILKAINSLSNDDRRRLHILLCNDVPRRISDNPSVGDTLSLIESRFDQDKMNEQDLIFLINAFEAIQCTDAVELLKRNILFLI
jgi:hypothetical protein